MENCPLDIDLKGTGKGRNAYISLGVDAGAGAIDIGIHNIGQNVGSKSGYGWEPYCNETNPSVGHSFKNKGAPAGTKRARVEVTPNLTNKQYVRLSVQWLDGSNKIIDSSKNLNEEIKLTTAFEWTAFFRFASLVSTDSTATRSDSTFMLGGEFMDVKVGSSNWGISTSTVDRAWIINHPKCQLPQTYCKSKRV